MTAPGLTLDTGALLASERGDPKMRALLRRVAEHGAEVHVPAGVVAQAWRGGARQARLARLLDATDVRIVNLDELAARAVGQLCGASGHSDIVDVHVVLNALEHGHRIVTSDPSDLTRVDASVALIVV